MKAQHFTFNDGTGLEIYVYKWLPDAVEDIKGVFQIAHGMAEHAARYEKFAKVLTDNGYAVFANDHRGHGKTAGNLENIGRFYDGDLKVLIDEIIQYGDKTIEIITGTRHGGGPQIRIFNWSGKVESQFFAYNKNFFY